MRRLIVIKGYPKHLNSKADYLYVKNIFPQEIWEKVFKELLDDRMKWLMTDKLDAPEGIEDETHQVRITKGVGNIPDEYYQYEYAEDTNCKLFRLGFTVTEIERIIENP